VNCCALQYAQRASGTTREQYNVYGLIVDRLIGEEQVVEKPLSSGLETNSEFLGATIMGDSVLCSCSMPQGLPCKHLLAMCGRSIGASTHLGQTF
jgi:hypothetical protein